MLDEFLHFAAAFTDKANDDTVGGRITRHHSEENALAHTAAGKQTEALAAAHRQQRIDGANADIERRRNRLAFDGIERTALQRAQMIMADRAELIERPAGAIDHTAKQSISDRQLACSIHGAAAGMHWLAQARPRNVGFERSHRRTGREPMRVTDRHEKQPIAGKTDHFSFHRAYLALLDQTSAAHRQFEPDGFHDEACRAREIAAYQQRIDATYATLARAQEVATVGGVIRRV